MDNENKELLKQSAYDNLRNVYIKLQRKKSSKKLRRFLIAVLCYAIVFISFELDSSYGIDLGKFEYVTSSLVIVGGLFLFSAIFGGDSSINDSVAHEYANTFVHQRIGNIDEIQRVIDETRESVRFTNEYITIGDEYVVDNNNYVYTTKLDEIIGFCITKQNKSFRTYTIILYLKGRDFWQLCEGDVKTLRSIINELAPYCPNFEQSVEAPVFKRIFHNKKLKEYTNTVFKDEPVSDDEQ